MRLHEFESQDVNPDLPRCLCLHCTMLSVACLSNPLRYGMFYRQSKTARLLMQAGNVREGLPGVLAEYGNDWVEAGVTAWGALINWNLSSDML